MQTTASRRLVATLIGLVAFLSIVVIFRYGRLPFFRVQVTQTPPLLHDDVISDFGQGTTAMQPTSTACSLPSTSSTPTSLLLNRLFAAVGNLALAQPIITGCVSTGEIPRPYRLKLSFTYIPHFVEELLDPPLGSYATDQERGNAILRNACAGAAMGGCTKVAGCTESLFEGSNTHHQVIVLPQGGSTKVDVPFLGKVRVNVGLPGAYEYRDAHGVHPIAPDAPPAPPGWHRGDEIPGSITLHARELSDVEKESVAAVDGNSLNLLLQSYDYVKWHETGHACIALAYMTHMTYALINAPPPIHFQSPFASEPAAVQEALDKYVERYDRLSSESGNSAGAQPGKNMDAYFHSLLAPLNQPFLLPGALSYCSRVPMLDRKEIGGKIKMALQAGGGVGSEPIDTTNLPRSCQEFFNGETPSEMTME